MRLGNEDIKSSGTNVQRIPISDIIYHPEYKRSMNYNDVAILKLKTRVQVSNTVKPICLQTRSLDTMSITSRTPLVVIGWGATSFDTENSVKLMRTPSLRYRWLKILIIFNTLQLLFLCRSLVDREECTKYYTGFLKLPRGIDENLICAMDPNSTRRADACQGDSGGPLLMLTETGDSVIGITAFGQSCGSSVPGVYTAIHSYLDWIEEHVWLRSEPKTIIKTEITYIAV